MLQKGLSELRRIVPTIGIDRPLGENGIRFWSYLLTLLFLTFNAILHVIFRWNDINTRMDGLKGLGLYLTSCSYLTAVIIKLDDLMRLLDIIEEGHYKYPFQTKSNRLELQRHIRNGMMRLNAAWYYILAGFVALLTVSPLLIFVFRMTQTKIKTITVDMLYTSLPFYFPKNYDTLSVFFVSITLQSYFFLNAATLAYFFMVCPFVSMQLLEGDLKLLQLAVDEVETIIKTNNAFNNDAKTGTNNNKFKYSKDIENNGIRYFLYYFVRHHQDIYRKVDDIRRGIKLVVFIMHSGMSVMLCTAIFTMVQKSKIIFQIQEAIYCSIQIYSLYCYDLMGEKISNQDQNLRNALYQCPWIDQPLWFQKSLQLIMIRMNKTIEINSMGLFTLNLKTFSLTMRAAYSFYNILNRFTD